MMSPTEINVTPKQQKIAKFQMQILVDNSKRFSKHTIFIELKKKMTELGFPKLGTVSNSKIDIMANGIR